MNHIFDYIKKSFYHTFGWESISLPLPDLPSRFSVDYYETPSSVDSDEDYPIIGIVVNNPQIRCYVAKRIQFHLDDYKIVSFNTPIKQSISHLINISMDSIENSENIELVDWNGLLFNEILEWLENNLRNKFISNFTKVLIKRLFDNNSNNIIIDDVRFMEEYSEIKKRDGIVIKITGVFDELSEIENTDIPGDYIIVNNGSLESLYEKIDKLMTQL